jgi:hypothetical protein
MNSGLLMTVHLLTMPEKEYRLNRTTNTNPGIPLSNQVQVKNLIVPKVKLKSETRITGFATGSPGAPRNYASDQIKATWVKAESLLILY